MAPYEEIQCELSAYRDEENSSDWLCENKEGCWTLVLSYLDFFFFVK
jgi:hypothetical protein